MNLRIHSDQTVTTQAALTQLFESEVDAVFGFVFARSGSRDIAEEVTADTFAEAARVMAGGRGAEITRGWLFDVARKRLVDYWRRAERRRRRLARYVQLTPSVRGLEIAEETDSAILDALDTLPVRQRAALIMRYLDGYSVSEVAEQLDASYEATESLLARGRRSLLAAYERSKT